MTRFADSLSRPEAVNRVIVDEPHRLHERVTDRRPDEFESAVQQVAAEGVRLRCSRRDLPARLPAIHPRLAADKSPDVVVETPKLPLNSQKRLRVPDGADNL